MKTLASLLDDDDESSDEDASEDANDDTQQENDVEDDRQASSRQKNVVSQEFRDAFARLQLPS